MLVVGAEKEGISAEVLDASDACVLLPMDGFVPSYNLQVALLALLLWKHCVKETSIPKIEKTSVCEPFKSSQ